MLATVLETNLPRYKSTKSESTFCFQLVHVNFSLRFFTGRLPMINDLIEEKNSLYNLFTNTVWGKRNTTWLWVDNVETPLHPLTNIFEVL